MFSELDETISEQKIVSAIKKLNRIDFLMNFHLWNWNIG